MGDPRRHEPRGRPAELDGQEVGELVVNTMAVSVVAAVAAVVLVLPVAYLSARHRSSAGGVANALVVAGFALPGLVIALSITYWVLQAPGGAGLYQTFPVLIVAYVVHFGAQAMRAGQVAVAAVPHRLEDAARMLGAGRVRRFRTLEVPLMLPGLAAGAGLVLLSTMKELPATLLLAPIGFRTLATRIWSSAEEGFLGRGRAPRLVLVAVSGVLTWVLVIRRVRRARLMAAPARPSGALLGLGSGRSSSSWRWWWRPARSAAAPGPGHLRRPHDGRRAAVPAVGDQPGRGPRPRHLRRAARRSAGASSTRSSCPEQTEPRADGSELSPHDPLLPLLLAVPVAIGGWVGREGRARPARRPAGRGHDVGGGPPVRGARRRWRRAPSRLRPRAAAHRLRHPGLPRAARRAGRHGRGRPPSPGRSAGAAASSSGWRSSRCRGSP